MKTISAAAILVSSVLLWECSICYGISCFVETSHWGIKGGWKRLAYWNMADKHTRCPAQLKETNPGKRLCIKSVSRGCTSLLYKTHGTSYTHICGRIKGYAYASPDAFGPVTGPKNIDSDYMDGVSITYGKPRKHVWTYAAGLQEDGNGGGNSCPCTMSPGRLPPSFVGNNYYCESANRGGWERKWYLHDPLWDGHGCPHGNNCCANAGLPWFCRKLPIESKEDIEVRLCLNQDRGDEDIGLELLELIIH